MRHNGPLGIIAATILAVLLTLYTGVQIRAQGPGTSLTTSGPPMPAVQAQDSGTGWSIQIRSNRPIPHVILRFSGLAAWHIAGPPSSSCDGGERVGMIVPVTRGGIAWDFGRGTNSTVDGSATVVDCTVYLSLTPITLGHHRITVQLYTATKTQASPKRVAGVGLKWRGAIVTPFTP